MADNSDVKAAETVGAILRLESSSQPSVQQRSMGASIPGTGRLDPDAASLSLTIDQHMQALTKDAMDYLLGVKARMVASLESAVAQEHDDGNSRLQAKQAEVDAITAEAQQAQLDLCHTEAVVDRLAGAYAAKQQAVCDRLNLLRSWYVWREHTQKQRRLQHLSLRLQQWYVRRWLLGRAWDRWSGQARLQYRTLVAERAEKQQKADSAALHAIHAQEAGALRAQIDVLQKQLQDEAQARDRMEEEMKRSFMRGVTAINLEALQIMRRGAPPSGRNPFPMTLPLNSTTAAAGLLAVGSEPMSPATQQPADKPDVAIDLAGSTADPGVGAGLETAIQNWVKANLQPQNAAAAMAAAGAAQSEDCQLEAASADSAAMPGTGHHAAGAAWGQASTSAQKVADCAHLKSLYGAATVVQLQPSMSLQQHQHNVGCGSSSVSPQRHHQQSPAEGAYANAALPKVYVERGPGPAAAPHIPKPAMAASPHAVRSAGVRKALQKAAGKPAAGKSAR